MTFTDETVAAARSIIERYPEGRSRSALLPMLHLVQSEEGCVTPEGVKFCAEQLGLTTAEVGAVATFYTMYKRRPVGDWLVSVCTNLSCTLLGGQEIFDDLSKHLGVGHDETTADGSITFEHAECLAACDYAPVMTVNYEFYDNVDPASARGIVDALGRGERPAPSRGAPLCTFAEISRELAGLPPARADAVGGPASGVPSIAGLLIAERDSRQTSVADEEPAPPAPATSTPAASAPATEPAPTDGGS
ncbi:MAG: NADH-quinone oxidoreductase subunit NuoE [Frankia sp.]